MYEKYFNKLREECLIRNRSSRTADTYINNIRHFMKWTGYKPMEDLSLQDARSFILENVIPVFHLQPATFIILPFAFYTNMSYTFHGIKTLFQECDWM